MESFTLEVPQQYRYYQLGKANEACKEVWFVLHGYGQLARYFLRHFQPIQTEERVIIAPEAPNRFYLSESSGRVGATWMTNEDRETDIANYLLYLNKVYERVVTESMRSNSVKIVVLGFSQGAATATRWAMQSALPFSALVLWAGILPFDMSIEQGKQKLHNLPLYWVYGTEDEYLNNDKFQEQAAYVGQLEIEPTLISFSGGHHIQRTALEQLATQIEALE